MTTPDSDFPVYVLLSERMGNHHRGTLRGLRNGGGNLILYLLLQNEKS